MPIINMVYKKKKWWKPWANTIAYYPLTSSSTVNDLSWNNRNLTNSWGTFWVYQWVDSCYINGMLYYNWITNPNQFTISCFYNLRTRSEHYYLLFWIKNWTGVDVNNQFELWEFNGRPDGHWFWVQYVLGNNSYWLTEWTEWTIWTWYHWVVTYDGTTLKIYLNGVLANSRTVNLSATRNTIFLWYNSENSQANISEWIIEDKARSETEITQYLNSMKNIYWIS